MKFLVRIFSIDKFVVALMAFGLFILAFPELVFCRVNLLIVIEKCLLNKIWTEGRTMHSFVDLSINNNIEM